MRPTRSGLLVAVGAAALVAVGRLLGLPELYAIGAALGLLALVCGAWVALRRIDIVVTRSARPPRVHAGGPCTVEIQVRNRSRRATPVLRLLDPVSGTAGADLLLAPIGLQRTTSVAYRLPTARRGIVTVGPMQVEMSDPFGLATARNRAAPAVDVTVLPRVDDIPPLARSIGPDPDGTAETGSLGRSGEDFAALRPYVVGDDMRRVHWPSSARTDELLVRQHDVPWQGRVCLVLDQRRQGADAETFERVVSAVASILRAHLRRGDHVRLVTTTGSDSGYGVGASHLDGLLEHLAVVERTGAGSLQIAVELVERGASGAVVLVSGHPSDADVDLVERVGTALSVRRVVCFDRPPGRATPRRTEIVTVRAGATFADAWTEATSAAGSRRRRAVRSGS
ncbi:MAG TPA: DUF58 domain-containing protein [Acidimicrobiales bacterium]|nr:DUF58 domain-containing protein [Acidimicrobiales bacterium]